jgi:hypothetical protein
MADFFARRAAKSAKFYSSGPFAVFAGFEGGRPRYLTVFIFIPKLCATVIPRSASDEESYCKDFSLPLEMTVWVDFEHFFALLSAKMPWWLYKPIFESKSKIKSKIKTDRMI